MARESGLDLALGGRGLGLTMRKKVGIKLKRWGKAEVEVYRVRLELGSDEERQAYLVENKVGPLLASLAKRRGNSVPSRRRLAGSAFAETHAQMPPAGEGGGGGEEADP
ncbi:hypothetical protein IE53DRAFT_154582 [Violaceomyces palustris]|uniref:Uncharacterized protein n=1 Tax=Violaceomyces palustris TaxID=1673888 RepID=A0ACD0NU06_9BASI|nr:hypothetical protein IE53DRAFT_154582 [Violaceomyces palustris]